MTVALRRRLAAAAVVAAAAAAPALASDLQLGLGVQAQRLREQGTDGRTLVREDGTSPVLRAAFAQPVAGAWIAGARLQAWASRADYAGRTQGGTPIASRTDTQSLSLAGSMQWRSPAAPAWALDAGLDVEHLRRHIRGAGGASGLDERLTQPRWQLGASWSGSASVRLGVLWGDRAPLTVNFDDGLYDTAHLRSGHAAGWTLDASLPFARRWRVAANVELMRVGRSSVAVLTRDGTVAGSVAQPQWQRERVQVAVEYTLE